mmetsp:Transcript_35758/g.86819  ORF Transcript_35758/g.86819 Transcript_35758/m.86819 type:complete len:91 (-) Transcript_35758:1929-2201(-)
MSVATVNCGDVDGGGAVTVLATSAGVAIVMAVATEAEGSALSDPLLPFHLSFLLQMSPCVTQVPLVREKLWICSLSVRSCFSILRKNQAQ